MHLARDLIALCNLLYGVACAGLDCKQREQAQSIVRVRSESHITGI